MYLRDAKARTHFTNCLFVVFLFSVLGWGLLHAWVFNFRLPARLHGVIVIPGLVMSGLAIYRYRLHWPANPAERVNQKQFEWKNATWYLLLCAIGVGFAQVISGSVALLAVLGSAMTVIPWAKIPVCRDHFFISVALLGSGTLLGLALSRGADFMFYPLAALFFWLIASVTMCFVLLSHGNRFDRMPACGY